MALNACKKGKVGEKEFCEWLKKNLGITAERRYNQAEGGSDVITAPFMFEVKRHETVNSNIKGNWWYQVVTAAQQVHNQEDLEPIVAYRQNRKPWKFLVSARMFGLFSGYIQMEEKVFINYATERLKGWHPIRKLP